MPTRADYLTALALHEGRFVVKTEPGEIYTAAGKRAEHLDRRAAYGRVLIQTRTPACFAMAHRVVWIAAHGLIPDGLQVNHLNGHRWDNRLANLELVTPKGNNHHRYGMAYDAIGQQQHAVPTDWLDRLDRGEPQPEQIDPYSYSLRTQIL